MLTDTQIRNAKPKTKNGKPVARKLFDGRGLYLHVTPTGSKFWRYGFRLNGKQGVYSIGEYLGQPQPGHTGLDEARAEHVKARALVKAGTHPKAARDAQAAVRQSENANTFGAAYDDWIARERKHWNKKYGDNVAARMECYVLPTLRHVPIRDVKTSAIRAIIEDVDNAGKAGTAILIRQHCSGVFRRALLDVDPTIGLRRHIRKPKVKHKKPLSKDGIKKMREDIDAADRIYPATRIALRLLMLLFVRPGELCRGEWSEFNLTRAVWTIPGEKMKKREPHLVPLSTQAIALLQELHAITGSGRWLFPNERNAAKCMSDGTLNAALRGLGYLGVFSAHGFRATADTELCEMGFNHKHVEMQLAHKERNATTASYNQAQYWDSRKAMMQHWSNMIDAWCSGGGSNVIAIARAA